jgi:hypothetical protein
MWTISRRFRALILCGAIASGPTGTSSNGGAEAERGRAATKTKAGRLNREICEKSEKQEDEEISRGDAENAEKKKHNYWKDLTTLKKETNRISPKTTSSFR